MTRDTPAIDVHPADADTIDRVAAILRGNDLPHADVTRHPERFLLAAVDDTLVGVGGVETYDRVGLLRSLVVREPFRGEGYGTALSDALESRAHAQGVETLYLLTTTAAAFFSDRGYDVVDRDAAPASIQQTTEFQDLCPRSATCMRRRL